MKTLSREVALSKVFLPFLLKRRLSKRKEWSKFFPFRVDIFLEVSRCAEVAIVGSHKKNGEKSTIYVVPLKELVVYKIFYIFSQGRRLLWLNVCLMAHESLVKVVHSKMTGGKCFPISADPFFEGIKNLTVASP